MRAVSTRQFRNLEDGAHALQDVDFRGCSIAMNVRMFECSIVWIDKTGLTGNVMVKG